MAAGDITVASQTPICWADDQDYESTNSGIARTDQINLLSLADGDAQQGVKKDLGATRYTSYACQVCFVFASAPTAGEQVHVLWSSSVSGTAGTGNTGGAASTGADADWDPGGAAEADRLEYMKHLLHVGTLVAAADDVRQVALINSDFRPPSRYGFPIAFNQAGVALDDSVVEMYIALIPNLENVAAS
jgi:hypothetical protein